MPRSTRRPPGPIGAYILQRQDELGKDRTGVRALAEEAGVGSSSAVGLWYYDPEDPWRRQFSYAVLDQVAAYLKITRNELMERMGYILADEEYSIEERSVMNTYRSLSDANQRMLTRMMEAMISEQED